MSADFIVGRYYLLEHRMNDGLTRFLDRAMREGNITRDDLMKMQSAKCVSRTRCTVNFYVPMLGAEIRVRVKRSNVECKDNEVAIIPQMRLEGGVYKGLTDYPRMTVYAYDTLGNNDMIDEEMQGVYR